MSPRSENGATLPAGTEAVLTSPPSRPTPPPSRRRDKPQLSCNLCRRRKLRCDRQHPCSSCSSRALTCTYAEQPIPTTSSSLAKPAASSSMHDRIVQLERLVMSLIPGSVTGSGSNSDPASASGSGHAPAHSPSTGPNTGTSSVAPGPTPVPASSVTEPHTPMDMLSECGSMCVSSSEPRYVGCDHWAAILDSIADLKHHFDQEEKLRLAQEDLQDAERDDADTDYLAVPRENCALLLYGCRLPVSRADILAALPPKSAVDRYISRYFNRLDLVHSIIHGPTFLREYEEFWTNPPSVPILWVGLLFSMICLALLASDASDTAHGDPEHRFLQVQIYREKTVQCLVMGNYTRSGPYVLETLAHYIYIELGIRDDANEDIWYLFAVEVNLAMRMGYHRDPDNLPGISPLQSEMRRRIWAVILQADILLPSQMGMPRMISDWKCDTKEPRNLNDADIDESTVELPPPRPETEFTTTLGLIARRRMYVALGAISDITAALQPCSYAEIMRVDGILQEAAASIPPPLKPRPLANSVTDTPEIIMARLFIAHLFYKGQIMLHRRFLYADSTSSSEDVFAYSRTACLDASLGALQIQNILDEETSPGGQLHMMRWRVSSIMNHTFLTATMILCSVLHRGRTLQRENEILTALRRTRTTWMRASSHSKEAKKAADTVSIVVARACDGHGGGAGQIHKHNNELAPERQGSQSTMPNTNPLSTGSSNSDISGFQRQDFLMQENANIESSDFPQGRFVIPGIFDDQGQMFNFTTGLVVDTSMGPVLEDWIQMSSGPVPGW
ncbi:fusarisetin A cluster transcription factor [Cladorrhinum sp. PSN332]|nr:fusarisetin A cluster transcription factor [Cladorrhinum sp. PSN332]